MLACASSPAAAAATAQPLLGQGSINYNRTNAGVED
jgi:hypothetical protein